MPAVSKRQQKFFGVVQAYLDGKIKNPSKSVVRAAESMSPEDIKHFASTKHKGLPEVKAAWTKTPVHIQNKDVEYDFDSIEQACEYLASIGVLSPDEVLTMLYDREPLINGFAVSYPAEKEAGAAASSFLDDYFSKNAQALVLVDPHRKHNEGLRALKVLDSVVEPEDTEKETDDEKARLDERVDRDKKDLSNIRKALSRIADFLS